MYESQNNYSRCERVHADQWLPGDGAVRTSGEVLQRDTRKLCGIIVSWVYTYVQTYENVHFFLNNISIFFFFFNKFIYLFIHFWLCWVFVSVRGLSLVVASGGHSSSRCAGLSLSRPLLPAEHRLQARRLSSCGSRA